MKFRIFLAAAICHCWLILFGAADVRAAVTTWTYSETAPSPSNWSATTVWTPASIPEGAGNVVVKNGNGGSSPVIVTLDAAHTIGIVESPNSGARVWEIADGGFALTMDNTGGGNNLAGDVSACIESRGSGNANVFPNLIMGTTATANSDLTFYTIDTHSAVIEGGTTANTITSASAGHNLYLRVASTKGITMNYGIGGSGSSIAIQNLGTGSAGVTMNGVIGPNASVTQNSTSSGLTLSAANSYTGATAITAGTLTLGIANAIPSGSSVTNNGTLNMNNNNDTIDGLSGSGIVTASGTITLTVGANNSGGNFSGVIQNTTGTLSLTKTGSGTQILSGPNTYTGNTTNNGGNLLINGSIIGNVIVNSGAANGGSGTISGSVTVKSGGHTHPNGGVANTIAGNLTYNSGTEADFDLNTNAAGSGNDQIILSGGSSVLNCSNVNVGINSASLDQNTDYALFTLTGGSASILGSFNATPVWLGTTPTNSSSYSILTLSNLVVLHFNPGVTNLASVTNLPASNLTGTTATLNGNVISTGGQTPNVVLYFGLTDGGTNPVAWTSNLSLGLQAGNFAAAISNLTGGTTYYFAASASNSAGVAWDAASKNFTTLAVTSPTVTNLPATSILATTASLNGQVLSTGNDTPLTALYYGPADGGTNIAGWSNSVALGLQSGVFDYAATGLATNTTYYYAATATNVAGLTWAMPSQSFTTLAANPPPPTNTLIQYLSGTDKDHTVPWQFFMTGGGRSNNVQTTIPVPSCWQTKGFGNYSYQNVPTSTSVGQYTTTFSVPASWAGQRIFLVYEGVLTDTATMINGQTIGAVHQGGFYEFSYEVTTNVVVGANTNVLNVTVSEWSANNSVNNAEREGDYWNFSGIFRPVYLMAKPPSNIDRLAVDAQASGLLNVNVFLSGITSNSVVVATVTDTNNVQLGNSFSNTVTAGTTNVLLSATLPSPQLWSSEFPNLYTLTVQLKDTNNVTIHTVTNLIGFRTISFSNGLGYFINGKKVLLRGICRHEFWPTDGRTTSLAESDMDIKLIKDMNFNAVRMTHYPPNKLFLQECDRLGLYVFDELTGWAQAYDNTIAPELVREMVIRDVNHPCIIAWDNGNEGGWNTTVDNNGTGSTNVYAIYDPQNRHINRPRSTFNNVIDDHYPQWSTFSTRFGAGATVYLPTEITHGLYDGGGGSSLSDYWDMMRTSTNGAGMFLWAFLDEGVVRDDEGGAIDVQDQNAPDGIVGPYRQPEASYYTYKSTYNPAQVTGPIPGNSFNGTLAVENRFSFTTLNKCSFDWQLGWYPDANDPASTFNTSTNPLTGGFLVALDSGSFAGPNVTPGATGSLVLPNFPANGTNYDALRLTASDPFGNNLYTWTWPLHTPAQIHDRILGAVSLAAPAITAGTSASEIIVTNGPRIFHFNNASGIINSLTVSNQPVSLSNGPRPVAGSAWTVTGITNYFDGTNYIILVNDITSAANGFQWTLRPDGWLTLTYRYTLTGAQNYMGVTFDYPTNKVTAMNWLGQGPYRVYKNRTLGQEIFVHTKTYNYTWTGQGSLVAPTTTPWVYPEFEGYHGQLNWAALQTTEQPITIVTPTTNLFFRVLTPPATDKSNVNPAYPPGVISLLHGIAPQGEKFDSGTGYAPSAGQNTATGLYTGAASFFFGPPPLSGADRDGNGLQDSWELQYFGALGQNPFAPGSDGVSLGLDNAFGLSPTNADPNVSRLPKAAPGTVTPILMAYRVPVSQLDYFSFIPQITDNLVSNWFGADQYPQYFLINTAPTNGTENAYMFQPNLTNWPGSNNHIFLRLQIDTK
jgi:autotransporter-associated beta strand protein